MGYYCEKSILNICKTNREILDTIYNQAFSHRQKKDVMYLPETDAGRSPFKAHQPLEKLFPDYREGDYVYFSSIINGAFDRNVLVRILPGYEDTEVWFNGEKQPLVDWMGGFYGVIVHCKKGENNFLAKVAAKKDNFDAEFLPIVPEVCVATNFYVYSCWHYMNEDGFRGQRGFKLSKLYRKDDVAPEIENIEWIYPVKPLKSTGKKFDFNELCKKGNAAYVYTQYKGKITIKHDSPMKVFEGGKEVYFAESGEFRKTYDDFETILLKSIKKDEWGFTVIQEGETRLDFVTGADCADLQWLWIGPFGRDCDCVDEPYAPEFNLQFEDVYNSVHGPKYWNFYRENTALIQTIQSNFYGQWFYALMVGVYGMKLAAAKLGKNKDFIPYYTEWMKSLCRHRDYGKFAGCSGIDFAYLGLSAVLDRLDPIGTIGINISEYCLTTGDPEAKYVLKLLADSLTYDVPRFSDGTFNRVDTMWTDDTYMSLPFMARLGVITGDEKYFDDILTQVRGFLKRMWMEEQKLFSHIYFVEEKTPNRVPWGRGNGWVLLALSEVLLLLPEAYHGREEILTAYRKFAEGVLYHRDKNVGMWHQVVNNHESFIESSGSAMFIIGLSRGIRKGWIDKKYENDVKEAWSALLENCIDEDGNLYGVCMGSGCNMEEKYYLELNTIVNDDHGVGIVLEACVEVMNMLGE